MLSDFLLWTLQVLETWVVHKKAICEGIFRLLPDHFLFSVIMPFLDQVALLTRLF